MEDSNWRATSYNISGAINPFTFFSIDHSVAYLGVDPGTKNLGMAVIFASPTKFFTKIYQIELDRNANAVTRMNIARDVVDSILDPINVDSCIVNMCIEGASFADRYRQVELAEQRAAIATVRIPINVQIYTPNTIRKQVFGDGRIRADEYWGLFDNVYSPIKPQPKDALAALSCAIFAVMENFYGYTNL